MYYDNKIILVIFIFISLILTLPYFVNEGFSQTREESGIEPGKIIKTTELRSSELEKIHSTIMAWKSSSNQEVYARDNNLIFSDNKIQVYVYLDNAESIVNIPQDIDIVDSDENIVVALVSSDQINQLAQLEFIVQIAPPITAIPRETERESTETIEKSNGSKINSIILNWMMSPNPEMFAENNNLIFSDNKIQVYVYLDNAESIVNIPQDIDIVDSDENIVVALVSSDQINQLAQLEFIVQIAPPIQATIPPIPVISEKNQNDNSILIGIGAGIGIAIVIVVGIIYAKNHRKIKLSK